MINCLFVGMGGFIGSVCRYLLGLLPVENSQGFPVKTLIINVTGAFVIGIIAASAAKNTSLNPGLVLSTSPGFRDVFFAGDAALFAFTIAAVSFIINVFSGMP